MRSVDEAFELADEDIKPCFLDSSGS